MKQVTGHRNHSVNWDQRLIDRLVDGEISAAEYRDLLTQFESHPDGWRVCATAFLESQAWRQAMREAAAAADGPTRLPSPRSSDQQQGSGVRGRSPWSLLTLAASIALAFLAGRFTPVASRAKTGPDHGSIVERGSMGTARPFNSGSDDTDMQLVNRGFLDGQSAIVPQIRKSLGRLGVQVSQEHGYIPAMTEDGTEVLVPYEDVKLVPVNHRPY